jgi:DNA mismatch repair protein MutS2
VTLHVELQPRDGIVAELNVVGCTVDEALDRVERFLDSALVTDQRTVHIVHGHGTGQLRRAVATHLREHPLVARAEQARPGVTMVEMRE